MKFHCKFCDNLEILEDVLEEYEEFYCFGCDKLKTLEGAPEECRWFNCFSCENLDYLLEHFPKCKKVGIENMPFEALYDIIGENNFIRLINKNSEFEYKLFFIYLYLRGLDFEKYIKPLLRDKTVTGGGL